MHITLSYEHTDTHVRSLEIRNIIALYVEIAYARVRSQSTLQKKSRGGF